MNLKDAILSTISEIESTKTTEPQNDKPVLSKPFEIQETKKLDTNPEPTPAAEEVSPLIEDEFLHNLRERILVLFEGFQSPNNAHIDAKIDLTLNFLEHLLAQIDQELNKRS